MADPDVDDVLAVISHVLSDPAVPHSVRTQIAALQGDVDDAPLMVHDRIVRLGIPVAASMPTHLPDSTLYRAVTLKVFQTFCARKEFQMLSLANFERAVVSSPSPDDFLSAAVDKTRVIFPASYSWMVDSKTIERRNGTQLADVLEINHDPPFVLCRLTPQTLKAAGVEVRSPTGLDAAIGLQPQWRRAGLPAGPEYVDRDIVGAAVDRALWRP